MIMKKPKKKPPKKIKTKGLVIPTDWDEKGNVSAVIISTHDEEEYAVKLNTKGRELLSLIREPIKVTGHLTRCEFNKVIDIEEYSILNGIVKF